MPVISYREALNQAMREEMERDASVFIMGEEVGHYNGAYKVTQGLLQRFSERRVVDAPIAEMGFAGIGVGAAMVGLRPIIEFMTFNFSLVAIDQIVNNAAKIFQMSGGQYNIPIVFRGPSGPAVQVSSQHSQSFESYYAHVPGLKVVLPSTALDAKGLLKTAIRDDNPVVFMEGETLYNTTWDVPDAGAGELLIPIGVADVKREGKDITLIAWSKMVWTCLDAAKELAKEGIECEVVDPRTLRPLDVDTLATSVKKTGRCVIVEVGWPVAGFGAEVAYQMQKHCMDSLDAPIERVCSDDVPMPYAKNLEDEVQPQVKDVVAAVKRALYLE
ncbi:MAG: pyruvate dehydrogenase complex E1 component subunit beta [Myxococcales bacterium]|nr:pyruvate dehydrogenase complex E1 component subunit beta [Myxococcales bacterium]